MSIHKAYLALILCASCTAVVPPKFRAGQLVKFKAYSFYSLCEGRVAEVGIPDISGVKSYLLKEVVCAGVLKLGGDKTAKEGELEEVK